MNKLIPGVLFSLRAAKEQRFRKLRHGDMPSPKDVRKFGHSWDRAAEGLRKADHSDGEVLSALLKEAAK